MTAAAEALPVIQRTPAWIEARQAGIGASEAAAALGISRWESPFSLWARKCGLVPPPELTLAMEIGTITEPLNAARFAEATGLRTRRVNRLLRSRAFPFLLASLDRGVVGEDAVLELKWTEHGDGYGEPGTDEVPDEVLVQVVQQMAVSGRSRAYVSVLFGGRRHAWYRVERDLGAEAAVIDRLAGFWRHVEERTQPPVDGSEATLRALAAAYPRDSGETLTADGPAAAFLARLRDVTAYVHDLEAEERELKAALQSVMGPASELVAPGVGRVTWKAAKDSTVTDWRAVADDLRSLVEESVDHGLISRSVLNVVSNVESLHTTTKPGSRRFLTRWEDTSA